LLGRDASGKKIGAIEDVMLDKESKEPRYWESAD
jgi:sporulation protein YlmC with PRC-barrel domain